MNNPLVSIITPCFNSSSHISKTIDSVLKQTYPNWELIVVNDASTDDSLDLLSDYAEKETRIKILTNDKNSGPAVSRNNGIDVAQGKFIAFLDSDDVWASEKLQKQVEFMLNNNYSLSFSEYILLDEKDNIIGQKKGLPYRLNYKKLLESNYIGCLTAMYDAEKLGKVYMPNILKRQDYGLWLKILKMIDYAYCIKEPLAYYRVRTSSVSSNKINLIKYNWKLFREVEGLSLLHSAYYLSKNIIIKLKK